LRSGNHTSYKYIYDRYFKFLCLIAQKYVNDDFVAAGIVNDLVFHLWEKRNSLHIEVSLKNYLIGSVKNRCINYLKSERARKRISSELPIEELTELLSLIDPDDSPLEKLLTDELAQRIATAIDHLPKECQEVFKMSRYEQLKYHQIGEILGISVNTVKYHMKNALRLLYDALAKYLLIIIIFFK
jgi:RNA polymerase sigma-70 factor (ECF subfamily)